MTSLTTRRGKTQAFLALSCVGTILSPAALMAQTTPPPEPQQERVLGGVTVTDTAIDEEPGRQQASPKAVRPLRDTPQTVTVLTSEVLQQQNLISLRDALSTVPGITFGAGEGGGGYGDSITLRGYSANNDITVDGVRDSAQYSRSDSFNIEQIEVTNGANSVTNGSGSVGGNINLVTKRPLDHDQAIAQAGVGTDNYWRGTVDVNEHLTDTIAVRLNAMYHHNDVPGRQVENADRWGVAPSITFGMGLPTKVTLTYFHQEDVNIPQYGLPYFSNSFIQGPLPGVDRSAYYGFRNLDTQRINIDQATVIVDHEFTDKISIRNLSRYQNVKQFSIADGPEGTFCLLSGFNGSGAACTTPGYFTPSGGSRGNTRLTTNELFYSQTDLKAVVSTGGIEHTIDFGASVSRENYKAATGNSQRSANGSTPLIPLYDISNPNVARPGPTIAAGYGNNVYSGPINFIVSARPHSHVENYAVYLFDAAKLSDHFEINGGVRWERNVGRFRSDSINVAAPVAPATTNPNFGQVTPGTTFRNADELFSYRVGLVYKPIETVSLYAAYGNSKTPSQSSVNGSCTAATCNVKPETAKNYEIGAKAELFDGGLLLTAALFRNERDSYRVASNDPNIPDQQLDGHSRVDGIALGASGHITPAWSITANYTYLDSKLIQSVSDYCLTHPLATGCSGNASNPDPAAGAPLNQTPKHSGSLYTAYTLPFGLTIGYGATYQGKFPINLPSATVPTIYYAKSYLVHNATISYEINRNFSAQVNVKNIGDKLYFTRIRANNGWATPGDARSATLTLTGKF